MPYCHKCKKWIWSDWVRDGDGNYYHALCLPKQEKPAAKKVVAPPWMASSTHKGSQQARSRWRVKYGREVVAEVTGRR